MDPATDLPLTFNTSVTEQVNGKFVLNCTSARPLVGNLITRWILYHTTRHDHLLAKSVIMIRYNREKLRRQRQF